MLAVPRQILSCNERNRGELNLNVQLTLRRYPEQ